MSEALDIQRMHGRWGEVYLGGLLVAEAIGVEFTIEIDQVEVPQIGGAWLSFMEGTVRGSGTLRMVKAYSGFERHFLDFVSKSKADLVALRRAGSPPRRPFTMDVAIDDPTVGLEQINLGGVKFWSMTGGFSLTELVNRDWPFTFTRATPARGTNNEDLLIAQPTQYAPPPNPK